MRILLAAGALIVVSIGGATFVQDLRDPGARAVAAPKGTPTTTAPRPTHQEAAAKSSGGPSGLLVCPIALVIIGGAAGTTVAMQRRRRGMLLPVVEPDICGRYWRYMLYADGVRIAEGYIDRPSTRLEVMAAAVARAAAEKPGHDYRASVAPATEEAFRAAHATA